MIIDAPLAGAFAFPTRKCTRKAFARGAPTGLHAFSSDIIILARINTIVKGVFYAPQTIRTVNPGQQ
ncbi:hypothetical protein KSZ_14210 [Dictyobacter formicarum]|uniref:Uncharacterized protein n=1 Tax=Dictyobacter formicarum TaxID=2778368 RepID=A0ABQ3VC95_9CHLR|nr:hypothetical protein KSZ_14210 [Dictyobacter formicarum]